MAKKINGTQRRTEALSRDQIVEAAIDLLDESGEAGLTFQTLSKRLATGPGAIYWHVANKSDLLTAACDAIVARTANAALAGSTPKAKVRELALGVFDAIDAHPWVGSALTRSPGQMAMVRILERIGQQVRALGVRDDAQWSVTSALLSYILGVGGQNAANAQLAHEQGLDRSNFLGEISAMWSKLDPDEYPFARGIAKQFPAHDDRTDFLTGIDLILGGIDLM
ncbi:AcrR family transcriptional regulator [Pararhizobium capsulatum DSM 1112]|uniref:AcrR family transcriptional regulator n=1 Tax=Pararhizobium capsulatum DSM 1112 TaxID=1121113 RepID=A0ABU0BNJ4_9HYPH|nr:TetR family transcriptional regulator [Pararhizobium capsulatum]MDQ0319819.1 AcrR family transcriptional regulator [Pararhizobium capsulatum DSM 1112]